MAGDSGLASAMASAGGIVAEEADVLLPLLDAGQLVQSAGEPCGIGRAVDDARRGVGRPRGAMNRRTAKLWDYLVTRYTHPADALAQASSRPIDVLAAKLGRSKLQALQVQMRAAAELLPYIESKIPVAVLEGIRGQEVLNLGSLAGAEGQAIDVTAATGLLALALSDEEIQVGSGARSVPLKACR